MNSIIRMLAGSFLVTSLASASPTSEEEARERLGRLFRASGDFVSMQDMLTQCSRHATFIALRSVGSDIAYEEVKRLVPVGVGGQTSLDVIYDAMESQAVGVEAVRVDCDSGELKKYLPGIVLVSGKIAYYSMEHVVYAEYDERSDSYRV